MRTTGLALLLAGALTATAVAEPPARAPETPAQMVHRWLVQYCRVITESDQQWECWTALARENMRTLTQEPGKQR
jgi:hypothetical protein